MRRLFNRCKSVGQILLISRFSYAWVASSVWESVFEHLSSPIGSLIELRYGHLILTLVSFIVRGDLSLKLTDWKGLMPILPGLILVHHVLDQCFLRMVTVDADWILGSVLCVRVASWVFLIFHLVTRLSHILLQFCLWVSYWAGAILLLLSLRV